MKLVYIALVAFAHVSIYLIYKISSINSKLNSWGDLFYDRLSEIQRIIKMIEVKEISIRDIKSEILSKKKESGPAIELPASSKAEKIAKISEGARRAWANRTPEMRAAMLAKRAETRAKRAAEKQAPPQDQGNPSQAIV